MRVVHGLEIFGIDIDAETRCAHWKSPTDIIAIKFKCCGRWYSCFDCHSAVAVHEHEVWPNDKFDEKAILCGSCGKQLSVDEYLVSRNVCPRCTAPFNPGCAKHYHLYFETR